ncbi:hypothetical protein MJO29_011848 [Puccinia striiformis f. sp. tritici]|nr:hypothetical protein MJO29_011848 [Puccinia striiformis f. sp. tritici]
MLPKKPSPSTAAKRPKFFLSTPPPGEPPPTPDQQSQEHITVRPVPRLSTFQVLVLCRTPPSQVSYFRSPNHLPSSADPIGTSSLSTTLPNQSHQSLSSPTTISGPDPFPVLYWFRLTICTIHSFQLDPITNKTRTIYLKTPHDDHY